jgi:AraC-like DNA-binding protein
VYLKTVRLNAAYRSLDASHTGHSTVAAIALQHGFTHLGRFSVAFRERFGESPSATLVARDGQKSHLNEIPDTTFVAASSSIH